MTAETATPSSGTRIWHAGDFVSDRTTHRLGVIYETPANPAELLVLWQDGTRQRISTSSVTGYALAADTSVSVDLVRRLRTVTYELKRAIEDQAVSHQRTLADIRDAAIRQYREGDSICREGLDSFLEDNGMEPLVTEVTVIIEVQVRCEDDPAEVDWHRELEIGGDGDVEVLNWTAKLKGASA